MAAALSAQVLDRRAERAAHAAGEIQVEGVPDGQAVERGQRRLVVTAQHHQDIVEAGGRDLSNRPANERLVAKRQEKFLDPHPR